jgi:hypothetical protein
MTGRSWKKSDCSGVALTRAQDEVLLTAAAWRRRFDGTQGRRGIALVDEPELLERERSVSARLRAGAVAGDWGARRDAELGPNARDRGDGPEGSRADDDVGGRQDDAAIAIGTPLKTSARWGRGWRSSIPSSGMVRLAEKATAISHTVRFGSG